MQLKSVFIFVLHREKMKYLISRVKIVFSRNPQRNDISEGLQSKFCSDTIIYHYYYISWKKENAASRGALHILYTFVSL